jgi:hypothetical protein
MTLQSGVPMALNIGGVDNSNTQTGYDRPTYVSGQSANAANQSPNGWFNHAAFVEAPFGQFGNVGRDTVIAPGTFIINGELHKAWIMPYNDHHQLQFRFEAFNALNHPNWGGPTTNILAGAAYPGQPTTKAHQGFGVISSTAQAMRQLQLGLKYTF